MLKKLRTWWRRRRFREGTIVSRFIARDVRRDIWVVSAARIDEGIITGRVRTTNVLYVTKGLVPEPEFGAASVLHIDEMWRWTGQSCGGLPDGASIDDQLRERQCKHHHEQAGQRFAAGGEYDKGARGNAGDPLDERERRDGTA